MKFPLGIKEGIRMNTHIPIEKGPIKRAKLTLGYILLLLLAA